MKYAAPLLVLASVAIAHPTVTLTPCPTVTTTVYETATAPPANTYTPQPPAESHPPTTPPGDYPHPPPEDDCPLPGDDVFDYDCTFDVHATPDQVRNGTTPAPGQPGATGRFRYGINIAEQLICYNILLTGVTGNYSSPALTATHIHEAARGASGPPRIAFPNPAGPDNARRSFGCLQGPFKTGVAVNMQPGTDTGDGFRLEKICQNPAGFFTDSHTSMFTLGAVRGQLA